MRKGPRNWLRGLVLVIFFGTFTCKNVTQVSYFSFISTTRNTTAEPRSNLIHYKQLLQSDDSPFASINLPWKINFLGENLNRMFINPNGGLHASLVQPCPPDNYFGTSNCDLQNSYYRVIAGMLTDLNPHTSANGNITSYEGHELVTIDFSKIAYFGATNTNSFRIVIYKDSHIEIMYDSISRNSNFPVEGRWVSGMRGSAAEAFAYFSPAQRQSASAEWGAAGNVPGIYTSKASVVTGNQFTICPVAREWCAFPNIVSRNATITANPSHYIMFNTTLLSCAGLVQCGVILTAHGVSSPSGTWSLPCDVVQNSSLQCELNTLVNSGISAGTYNVTPAWRLSDAELFQPLLVDHLLITIVNNSLYDSATQTYNSSIGCTNNAYSTSCAGDSCALCQGDYSCLNLPCLTSLPSIINNNVPVGLSSPVYDRVTCNNTCPIFSTSPFDTYFTDFNQTCCAQSDMDCSGQCGGVSQVALDSDGSVICCSPPRTVDCENVCGGTAQVDQCGVCEGDGLNCYDPTQVTITASSGGNIFYPVYDITTQSGWQQSLVVNVTNRSVFTIKVVFFESAETQLINPVLTMPTDIVYVQPLTWVIVSISSSIASLVQINSTTWANKHFTAQYERNVTSDPSAELPLFVYPQVTGCDTLHSARTACLRLPGCIYCFTNPYMRLLRGIPTGKEVDYSEADATASRQLFIELLPPVLGQAENFLYGMCADGRVNNDCAAVAPFYFVSSGSTTQSLFWVYITFLLGFVFIV